MASTTGTYANNRFNEANKTTRWMRVGATPVSSDGVRGETVYSEAMQMPEALGPRVGLKVKIPYMQNGLPENSFTVADKKFTLLDNNNGEIFVIADDYYGTTAYDDAGQKYDPTDPGNIGYYVVNTVLGTGENSLPAIIREHTVSKVWRTGAAAANGNAREDYAFTANAALLSLDEWEKYADKIGAYCNGGRWILRTADGEWCGDAQSAIRLMTTTGSAADANGNVKIDVWDTKYVGYAVRPVMYLDNDFFLDAVIPVADMGENVMSVIKENYSKEELLTIYSEEDVSVIYGETVIERPTVSEVSMSGSGKTTTLMSASAQYSDNTESVTYTWQVSSTSATSCLLYTSRCV